MTTISVHRKNLLFNCATNLVSQAQGQKITNPELKMIPAQFRLGQLHLEYNR